MVKLMQPRKRKRQQQLDVPAKANRILNVVLIGILLILLRVWHLGVIQHEEKLEESRRPQKRLVVEPARRGTIRDRYNIPLAINKVQYNAAIFYSHIRHVPAVVWVKEEGKKKKKYSRMEYIKRLAQMLAEELQLDAERLEDVIHSKAALFNHLPYVVKEDLSEQQYYRLKMLEKDWVGLQVQTVPKRYYPFGEVGGSIIGYMGAISRQEYEKVVHEIQTLDHLLKEIEMGQEPELPTGLVSVLDIKRRLQELVEHAYTINDYVGKTGIEGKFEEELRGFHGKKNYASDAKGNFLHELEGTKPPEPGKRILLTISKELQEYAERLLIQNEQVRVPRVSALEEAQRAAVESKEFWMKGGAIVAMEPASGDILAFASFPRFDPNDFIAAGNQEHSLKKRENVRKWFETETYLADVWNLKRPLERECFDLKKEAIVSEELWLDWDAYLQIILAKDSPVKTALDKIKNIQNAVRLQKTLQPLLELCEGPTAYPLFNLLYKGGGHEAYGRRLPAVQQQRLENLAASFSTEIAAAKKTFEPYIGSLSNNYDKVIVFDLLRLSSDPEKISDTLLKNIGTQSLTLYRDAQASFATLEDAVRLIARDLYREYDFKPWRAAHQKPFLKEKRAEEKALGIRYARPFLDLLDQKETAMFQSFWQDHRLTLLTLFLTGTAHEVSDLLAPYQRDFIAWHRELSQGAHLSCSWRKAYVKLQKAIVGFEPSVTENYLASLRGFEDLNRPLLGRYRQLRQEHGVQLEKHLAGAFYPLYGYGYARSYAYRQAATQGSIFKIITAYEALIQRYNKMAGKNASLASLNPLEIVDDTHKRGKAVFLGYDSKGKPIPQLYKGGRLLRSHRSGLGPMDVVKAMEVSSNPYFSLLASDCMENPDDLSRAAREFGYGSLTGIELPAEISGSVPCDLSVNRNGLYAMAVGQHTLTVTPLQTALMLSSIANGGKILKPRIVRMMAGKGEIVQYPTAIRREVFLPEAVRGVLLEGMRRVAQRTRLGIGSLSQLYEAYPEAISDLLELKGQMIGKSSTAESMERLDLDLKTGTNLYNHVWFGGIIYDKEPRGNTFLIKDREGHPELVVVVYLRFGAWGRDAAPLAAQVAQKWRDIKGRNSL